jgi:hypothetical protein
VTFHKSVGHFSFVFVAGFRHQAVFVGPLPYHTGLISIGLIADMVGGDCGQECPAPIFDGDVEAQHR